MKKAIRNDLAITLIALIVTIIILLILAGVSVVFILGDNGILSKANLASKQYSESEVQESSKIANTVNIIDTYTTSRGTINIDTIYPVGSIYMSVNSANPSTIFGGTWESYGQGKTLIGAGTGTDQNGTTKTFIVGDQSGEYQHTLTIVEMPNHNHGLFGSTNDVNSSSSQGWPLNNNHNSFRTSDRAKQYKVAGTDTGRRSSAQ